MHFDGCPRRNRQRLVIGADTGELLIVEGTELKAMLRLHAGVHCAGHCIFFQSANTGLLFMCCGYKDTLQMCLVDQAEFSKGLMVCLVVCKVS